jgi:trehalose/maltose transport system permease protein
MIPLDYYEAAKIDGVHPLKVFYKITLPLLKPVLIVAIIFRLLDALRIFDLIFILTSNSSDAMSLSIYARQQTFDFQHMGIGSAASTCLFFCVSCIAVFYLLVNRQESPHARPKY